MLVFMTDRLATTCAADVTAQRTNKRIDVYVQTIRLRLLMADARREVAGLHQATADSEPETMYRRTE
jgi:hypothetical protein